MKYSFEWTKDVCKIDMKLGNGIDYLLKVKMKDELERIKEQLANVL